MRDDVASGAAGWRVLHGRLTSTALDSLDSAVMAETRPSEAEAGAKPQQLEEVELPRGGLQVKAARRRALAVQEQPRFRKPVCGEPDGQGCKANSSASVTWLPSLMGKAGTKYNGQ